MWAVCLFFVYFYWIRLNQRIFLPFVCVNRASCENKSEQKRGNVKTYTIHRECGSCLSERFVLNACLLAQKCLVFFSFSKMEWVCVLLFHCTWMRLGVYQQIFWIFELLFSFSFQTEKRHQIEWNVYSVICRTIIVVVVAISDILVDFSKRTNCV